MWREGQGRDEPGMMTAQYLAIALVLAVSLNHAHRFVRAAGTALAALSLAFIVLSIVLADLDGTFAVLPADNLRPLLLNVLAAVATAAILFLLWATRRQMHRRVTAALAWRNSGMTYGRISRYLHWATATLMLCLIPMGLFLQTLPETSPVRAVFLAVHETLGSTVLGLLLIRLAWLTLSKPPRSLDSPRPWQRLLARAVHMALYVLLLLLPATGMLLVASKRMPLELYGVALALPAKSDLPGGLPWAALHNLVLPALFCCVIALHLGGALMHHFVARRGDDIRRMLR
jgi:cytochrome b561